MNRMISKLHRAGRPTFKAFSRFRDDDEASLSVEAVLVLPFLLWAFLAVFTFFDVYRAKNLSLKGNYAISDLLSRETNTLDMAYLNGAENLYQYLTQSGESSWLRVTVVTCTEDCAVEADRTLEVDWSRATDELDVYDNTDVMGGLKSIIPLMAEGERLIMVQTSMQYRPPFSEALTGIGARTFTDTVMTRPRFAPQLCFEGVGCGA